MRYTNQEKIIASFFPFYLYNLWRKRQKMDDTEIITAPSRSDGAKRMWKRRKAETMKKEVAIPHTGPSGWIFHAEWLAMMGMVLGCFMFLHHEYVHTNERLDKHMADINRRCDESSKRTDDLHKEFYDLLKEMRK